MSQGPSMFYVFVETDGSFEALDFYSNDDAETAQVSRARGPAAYLEDVTEQTQRCNTQRILQQWTFIRFMSSSI